MLAYNSYKYLYLETKNISYDNADDIDNKYKRLTNESIADYASVNSKVPQLNLAFELFSTTDCH